MVEVKAVIGTADNLMQQRRGIKSLVKRDREIWTFLVDSPENYRDSLKPHIGVDTKVSLSKH